MNKKQENILKKQSSTLFCLTCKNRRNQKMEKTVK